MCAWLEVSRSGYYAWRGAEPSQRSRDDGALIAVMKKVYEEARGNRKHSPLSLGSLVPGAVSDIGPGRAFTQSRQSVAI